MSDGTQPPAWINDLPEDLRANPSLAAFKGNDWKEVGPVLVKSFIETKALTGRRAYNLPSEDWKPEQWSEWNRTIGVPDAPDKYPVVDAEMAKKAGMSEDTLKAALSKCHELGMTPRQVKALIHDWYVPEAAKGAGLVAEQKATERTSAEATLKQEFGDKYEAKMGLVKAFLTKFGSPEFVRWADESGAGNQPEFVRAMSKAAESMLEDSSRGGTNPGFGPAGSKAEAMHKIRELKLDKGFMDQFISGSKDAVKRWNELHQLAYSA